MRIEQTTFNSSIVAFLNDESLPTDDLQSNERVVLFEASDNGEVIGIIGIESLSTSLALLRSFTVKKSKRKQGLGKKLVEFVERWARTEGYEQLYLLTSSASQFFMSINYENLTRDEAPAEVTKTKQYSSLCPDSASLMTKTL